MPAWGIGGGVVTVLLMGLTPPVFAQAPDWSVDESAYEHTLTVTAAVTIDGEPVDNADVLGAFVGERVRGVARPDTSAGADGEPLYFLTVYGNESGRTVRFRVYDASADTVREAERTVSFEPDAAYGTPSNPFQIAIGEGEVPDVENWTVDPTAYEQTMTVTMSVFVEPFGRDAEGAADRVAAFIDGEVRGVAEAQTVGERTLFFLTVYGDSPDTDQSLRVRFYDSRTDRVFPTETSELTFSSNAVKGTPTDPVEVVAVRPSAQVDGILKLEGISPHPLNRSALVRFAADRRVRVKLALYDALGREVAVLHQGYVNDRQIYRERLRAENLASGRYFLRLSGPRDAVTRPVIVVH